MGTTAADISNVATCQINIAGEDYNAVSEFEYHSDILQLGDPFSVTLGNPDGRGDPAANKINEGVVVDFKILDPAVSKAPTTHLRGIVTSIESLCDSRSGTTLKVGGADFGWYLVNCNAPFWKVLNNLTIDRLLDAMIDPSWRATSKRGGLTGVRVGNDKNKRLKFGRSAAVAALNFAAGGIHQRFQTEVGEAPADLLIQFAKREGWLINVAADGYLQIFQPDYVSEPRYTFHLHRSDEPTRTLNNIERSHLRRSIDGTYTDVICVFENVRTPPTQDAAHPNEGKGRGSYEDHAALPFTRRLNFSDGDVSRKEQARVRARWRALRGKFDAWVYTLTVKGLSQGGFFFLPDTMCNLYDTIRMVEGRFYVSSVRYRRDFQTGTTTELTLHKPNTLQV